MANLLATGQLTIVDYNDAISLVGFIGSTHPKTQVYSKDGGGAYTPSWASVNNILTPELYVQASGAAGANLLASGTNISNAKWTLKNSAGSVEIAAGGTNASYGSVGSAAPWALTLNVNCLTETYPSLECVFSCDYTDPTTGLVISFKTSVTFALMRSGGKSVVVQIYETSGVYVIRNGAVSSTTLTLKFKLFRNGAEDTTITGTAVWKYRDPGASSWTTAQTTTFTAQDPASVGNLAITALVVDAITNSRTYRLEFTDTGTEAEVSGTVYADEVTILDFTDNYALDLSSSAGDVFKNGVGSTVITPRLYRNGSEVDTTSGAFKRYRFSVRDKNGAISYFKSSYDLSTTLSAAVAAAATTFTLASIGSSPKEVIVGDELVIEPGVSGKEEIATVVSISSKTITCAALTYAHASGAVVKSANMKSGLAATTKTIAVTGDDIDVKGIIECEVLDA